MGKFIDISNQKFGYLTALYPTRLYGRFAWHCKCDCGREIDVESNNLNGAIHNDLVIVEVLGRSARHRCEGRILWCQ